MQIEFIEKKDKSIVLESLKDEYLGNKRKRKDLNNNESLKDDLQSIYNTKTLNEDIIENNEIMILNIQDIEEILISIQVIKRKKIKTKK